MELTKHASQRAVDNNQPADQQSRGHTLAHSLTSAAAPLPELSAASEPPANQAVAALLLLSADPQTERKETRQKACLPHLLSLLLPSLLPAPLPHPLVPRLLLATNLLLRLPPLPRLPPETPART
ncbi:unnamed protein product [Closterium sp. NIES-53]